MPDKEELETFFAMSDPRPRCTECEHLLTPAEIAAGRMECFECFGGREAAD